ncbi:MAG: exodeoxyribonuclease VII large subunit [Spirochaetales bacterium]|nr:exodeoxyribonuclease VII large subunit [Spirochaetales bacterium]MCP5484500.1 exodeoxyribonuclease VII large subunit [Spirochaetales bacterium]
MGFSTPPETSSVDLNAESRAPLRLSVTQVNQIVRDRLLSEERLRAVFVEGEVSNVNYHTSGHIYFSLKDNDSTIRCTFFRANNQRFKSIRLANGNKIVVAGSISLYMARGEYQINVGRVMLAGEGQIRLQIEALKQKLHAEGLFDATRKRLPPALPLTIGVATASTGAAIKDIIRTARRRYPSVNILLAPCRVQGEAAALSIVQAIGLLNEPRFGVDVIIAGRGGGSFEDLLAFNDERVVRAFAASRLPIVSAVGHDIDHPLSDLAADLAAPTPGSAAEAVVPDVIGLQEILSEAGARMRLALRTRHTTEQARLKRVFRSRVFANPLSLFEPHWQGLDRLIRQLTLASAGTLSAATRTLQNRAVMLPVFFERRLHRAKARFGAQNERLLALSPLGVLGRGFAVVRDQNKAVVRDAASVSENQTLEVLLRRGRLLVRVESAQPAEEPDINSSTGK